MLSLKNGSVVFSNNFNTLDNINNFCYNESTKSLQVGNLRVLIKLGTSLLYFHDRHLQRMTLIREIGLHKENHYYKNSIQA